MVVWMGYAVAVAALVGAAAFALERAARLSGRPARRVWTGAVLISVVVPAAAWLWAGLVPAEGGGAVIGPAVVAEAPDAARSPPAFGLLDPSLLEGPARAAWGAGAGALLLMLAGASVVLSRRRRRWRREVVAGTVVRVSPDLGPAVIGLTKPEVVLPRWVLAADEEVRRWIVAHEVEHVRARDPIRLAAALLPAILLPWNLPLWWQLRRLRQAVEIDCDDRVLADADQAARRRYGRLLLEVGRRSGPSFPLLAAFAETPSFLERRIRAMSRGGMPVPPGRVAALVAGAGLLLAGACLVPGPDRESVTAPDETAEVSPVDALPPAGKGDVASRPTFTPYTVAPKLVNESEVQRALQASYPPLLRDAGIGGRVLVYFFIDADGRLADVRVNQGSGHEQLDRAALEVARVMEFTPALNRDRRVPVWISLPITFGPRVAEADADGPRADAGELPPAPGGRARAALRPAMGAGAGEPAGSGAVDGRRLSDGPTFTPFTVAPKLVNEAEVQRALERAHPPLLRDAGIGGRVLVYFLIDADGRLADVRVNEGSGHEQLDRAALEVARAMEFTPARNRDRRVPVWISLPVTFQVR